MASTKKPRRPRTAKDLGSGIFYVPGTWWGLEARSARSLRLLLDNDRLFIALAQAFIAADRLAALHSFMEWNDR